MDFQTTTTRVPFCDNAGYRGPVIDETDVVIVISQSGETADTLEASGAFSPPAHTHTVPQVHIRFWHMTLTS